jgi:hypothetical protein
MDGLAVLTRGETKTHASLKATAGGNRRRFELSTRSLK